MYVYTSTPYRWLGPGNMMVQARFFDATFAPKLRSGFCSYLTIFVQIHGRQNHASSKQHVQPVEVTSHVRCPECAGVFLNIEPFCCQCQVRDQIAK